MAEPMTDDTADEIDWDDDDYDPGEECGRWSNGKPNRHCSLAGTEFCDFECPYRDAGRSSLWSGDDQRGD